ncbi:hypothetical protein FHETE_9588 [Fusarium heterosporum]|uniref:Uncharacterized protein n=1 Tax=Fusarium heterosporum TaxID=42747 RepID=A0A8H5SXR3_FUSHE|nr:hypothetical protein FHETE_9588 [Fusarium heterosporum]
MSDHVLFGNPEQDNPVMFVSGGVVPETGHRDHHTSCTIEKYVRKRHSSPDRAVLVKQIAESVCKVPRGQALPKLCLPEEEAWDMTSYHTNP